jgi:hypothetical protein
MYASLDAKSNYTKLQERALPPLMKIVFSEKTPTYYSVHYIGVFML